MPNFSYVQCGFVLASVHALVQTAGAAELVYEAPAACPDREELSFRIVRALGKPLEAAPPTRFDVVVRREAGGFGATVRAESAAGEMPPPHGLPKERTLEAADCSQLIDAVSVAVVLALGAVESEALMDGVSQVDGARGPSGSEEAGSAPDVAAPNAALEADGEAAQSASSSAATTIRPGLFVWMLGDVGSLPSAAVGLGIGAHVGWSSWQVRAHASVMFDQHVDIELASAANPGADLGLALGGLALCRNIPGPPLGATAVAICLGGELGRMSGRGTNVVPERSGAAFWAAPSLDASGRLELGGGAGLELMLGVALPLTRNPFIIDEIGAVHRASSLVGRGALGLSFHFR